MGIIVCLTHFCCVQASLLSDFNRWPLPPPCVILQWPCVAACDSEVSILLVIQILPFSFDELLNRQQCPNLCVRVSFKDQGSGAATCMGIALIQFELVSPSAALCFSVIT